MKENFLGKVFWGDLNRTEGQLDGAYRDPESPRYHSPAYGEAKGVAVAGTPALGKVSNVGWVDDLAYGVQDAVVKYGGLGYQFVSEILKGEDDWYDKGQRDAMEQYVGWREGRISAGDLTDPDTVWEIATRIDTDLFDKK